MNEVDQLLLEWFQTQHMQARLLPGSCARLRLRVPPFSQGFLASMLEGWITTPQRNRKMLKQVFNYIWLIFCLGLWKKHDFCLRSLPAAADNLLEYRENQRKRRSKAWVLQATIWVPPWGRDTQCFPSSRKASHEAISMALLLLMGIHTNSPAHRNIFCCLFN